MILDSNEDMDYNSREGTLATLNLSYNEIGERGAKNLCDALQNNKTLKILILSDNEINDTGVQYLANILQNNTVKYFSN
ncbi:unnamed protein product [Adineta steineri]|uniref:Uncharacterized protein n=1 Tax=Adineta steineri TaxID=433720 RepID=A0A820GG27_9BILA|nr:unnamed protein product [Adineta steineri]